jgi:hypothetical protein
MTEYDVFLRFRKQVFSLAEEIGVAAACRAMGIHRSTSYRWCRQAPVWKSCTRESGVPQNAELDEPADRTAGLGLRPGPSDPLAHSASPMSSDAPSGVALGSAPTECTRCFAINGLNTMAKRLGRGPIRGTAGADQARARARHRRLTPRRAGFRWAVLDRSAVRSQGCVLPIHCHRRRLRIHLGRVASHSQESLGPVDQFAGTPGCPRPL